MQRNLSTAKPKSQSESSTKPHWPKNASDSAGANTNAQRAFVDTATSFPIPDAFSSGHWQLAARVGREIVDALAHAHAAEVVHRDVKPSNVLLDDDGKSWVTDFGLAKLPKTDLTQSGMAMGTLRYMSPEQLRGNATAQSDIYSFGVLFSELLTLRQPHEISVDQVPRLPDEAWQGVPTELRTIAERCIPPSPVDRYPGAREIADDLQRFIKQQPILAKRPSRAERILWRLKQHRILSLAFLFAAFMLLIAIGALIYGPIRNDRSDNVVEINGVRLVKNGGDRDVAEWVLAKGGSVRVLDGDGWRFVRYGSTDPRVATTLPASLFNLRQVHLTGFQCLTEARIQQIGRLPRLQVFSCIGSNFDETWAKHLRNATELEYLNLNECHITDAAMSDLAALPLTFLGLNDNNLTDSGIAEFRQNTSVSELLLKRNQRITDRVFDVMSQTLSLELIDVSGTAVTETAAGMSH